MTDLDRILGAAFDDADVARAYAHRAPYPAALIERLAALAPARRRALDLGCGPGKLTVPLADRFGAVTAVDPAAPMIDAARDAAGSRTNIDWITASAEKATLSGRFDLAVAGASIHWMDLQRLFPRLAPRLVGPIAVLDGDGPTEAPWKDAYMATVIRWVERLGGVWNNPALVARSRAHEAWIDIAGRETFSQKVRMRADDLIDGEHSRATWARARMGPEPAAAFDADLRAVLGADEVEFRVETRLLWGRARATPRA